MPTWRTFLQIIVLLSIAGFALVILSGYWHIMALLVIAAIVIWLWRHWPPIRK